MIQLNKQLKRVTFSLLVFSLLFMFLQIFSHHSNFTNYFVTLEAQAGNGTTGDTGSDLDDDDDCADDDDDDCCPDDDDDDCDDDDDDEEENRVDLEVGDGCEEIRHPLGTCSPICTIFLLQQIITLISEAQPGFIAVGFDGDPDCTSNSSTLSFLLDSDNFCRSVCIPFLSQIPLIASLFSQTPDLNGNQILLFLLSPLLVTNTDDEGRTAAAVAQEIEGLENVVVVITLPEGVIVNSASINGDEEACEIISDTEIECTIEMLTEETELTINAFVPDLDGELIPVELTITTDSFPGVTLEQVLNIVAGTGDEGGGGDGGSCTLAKSGGSYSALILLAFLPALILFRRMIRKKMK